MLHETSTLIKIFLLSQKREMSFSYQLENLHSLVTWCDVLCGLQVSICLYSTRPHGLQGHSCLMMTFITSCRGISALAHGASPFPPCSLTWVSEELSSSHILSSFFSGFNFLLHNNLFSILNCYPRGWWDHIHPSWWTWLCPVSGPSCLVLALSNIELLVASHRSHHSNPFPTTTLPHKNLMQHQRA